MLAAALKDNEQIKELYLGDNKIQPSDGNPIAAMIKENTCLDILDLRNNSLQDTGLSHICSGLSEQHDIHSGLKALVVMNNNITASGISYLSKALVFILKVIMVNHSK
jgi:protein phosphatase 1 regulatory subunit 37